MKTRFFLIFFAIASVVYARDLSELKIEKKYNETGIDIFANTITTGEIHYRLYNPFYKTSADGILKQKEKLYVPYGTEICMWIKTQDGKNFPATHFIAKTKEDAEIIQIVNPLDGIWNEKQILYIDADKNTEIMYSVDGSDPAEFGLLYTEPILIDKTGSINLRIKAISEDGSTVEKKIEYTVSDAGSPSTEFPITKKQLDEKNNPDNAPFKILNWYFVEFDLDSFVYYFQGTADSQEPLKSEFKIYDGPLFTERDSDTVLYWYCKNINDGEIHKIELPKKPQLSGCPLKPVNGAVELSFNDLRFSYFLGLEEFKSGKYVFDCAANTEKEFIVKITVLLTGIVHGSFTAKFKIDKIPPAKPNVIFTPAFSPANKEVKITFQETDKEELVAEISPADYARSKNQIILTGSGGNQTVYSVTLYNKDAAGNKSTAITKEFLIEKNVIYVDVDSGSKNADGNPSDPFVSIIDAVQYINRISAQNNKKESSSEKWKIFLRSDIILNEAVLITQDIKLVSADKKAVIRFSKNAGFVVNGASLEIENTDIFRREYPEEPREVPVIYVSNGTVKLSGVKVHVIEGGSVVKTFYSHLETSNSEIVSEQTGHCVLFNLNNSSAVLQDSSFNGKGSSAAAVSCSKCTIELDGIHSMLTPDFTARFLEAWDSEIGLGKLNCIRNPENGSNRDSAVWYSRSSVLDIKYNPIVRGYAQSIEKEP